VKFFCFGFEKFATNARMDFPIDEAIKFLIFLFIFSRNPEASGRGTDKSVRKVLFLWLCDFATLRETKSHGR